MMYSMNAADKDLGGIQNVLHSLDPGDYIQFMKEVHFNCPFRTNEMTEEIVNHWRNDHSMKHEEFDKIIKERDLEHIHDSKENRQRDLRRIQDMNSKSGLEPLQIFPKEIWMMLLHQLHPSDLYNFRQVHETFQDLTNETLGDITLPLLLGFHVERFWGEPYHPEWASIYGISQKPKFCPLAQYTELRLLSKSLRNAVDLWFEDDIISKLKLHNGDNKKASPSGVIRLSIQSKKDFRKFLKIKEDLKAFPKLPRFFTRSLHIIFSRKDRYANLGRRREEPLPLPLEEFPMVIDEILEHIGSQILYFSVEFNHLTLINTREPEPGFAERYTTFQGWLQRMPHLRWLKVTINQLEKESRYGFRIPDGTPPPLGQLERLDLELKERNRYILPVFNQILGAYPQVKILNLIGMKSILKEKNGFIGSPDSVKIPLQLEALLLAGSTSTRPERTPRNAWNTYDSSDDDEDIEENKFYDEADYAFDDVTLFQSIIDSKWPLRQIDWEMKMGNVYADGIITLLGYIPTLEKIRLSLDDVIIRSDKAFLRLPELKHFELSVKKYRVHASSNWGFFFSLQYLIYAKKLDTLIWKCDMKEECWQKVKNDTEGMEHLGVTVDFDWVIMDLLGYREYDYIGNSNIWHVFRSLETMGLEMVVRENSGSGSLVKKSVKKRFRRCDLDFSHLKEYD